MNVWTNSFMGVDKVLLDVQLSQKYKQEVLPLQFEVMQQVSIYLSKLLDFFKQETSKLEDFTSGIGIKEDLLAIRIADLLKEWKGLINESWQMLFSKLKKEMEANTKMEDPDQNEPLLTADSDLNDLGYLHQELGLRTQLNVDRIRQFVQLASSQLEDSKIETDDTDDNSHAAQILTPALDQTQPLIDHARSKVSRISNATGGEFVTDLISDDVGPFETLFDKEMQRDAFIRIRISDFQTDLSDSVFFERLETGWSQSLITEYSMAKPKDDSGIDETAIETATQLSVGSNNSAESDFRDPRLETKHQFTKLHYSEPKQQLDHIKCKITGKIDRSQQASMTAIMDITPVPQRDNKAILEYLTNHSLILGCCTDNRVPSISILRGNRGYAAPVEHSLPKHDLSTQEYVEELRTHIKVTESTVLCPELFRMTEFQQVSSVAPFDEQTGPFDEPRLLISSSNHIAVVCEQSDEVKILHEPKYTKEVPPIGMRTCKSFDGKIAVFRVDVQPIVYSLDRDWKLNMYFTSEWHFYGRTFCNSWNCTDRGVKVDGQKLFFLGYDPSRDMQPHHTRKYPEIRARLVMVDFSKSYNLESESSITGVEDFLVESTPDSKDNTFVVLRSDGEVLRIDQSWKIVKNQRTALKYLDQVSFWSALGHISGMLVAVGYINTRDRSAVMYYLLDKEIKMAGGVALEVPLRKMGSIAPPVIATISKSLLWKKRYHQETVNLLLAILGSGEIHVLGLKDKLFLLHKITSNESQNYCAASLCQVGDQIYTGGQLYLRKIQFSF